jgi:hypothetical protein
VALVSYLAITRAVARNPDDSVIGRLRVAVELDDVTLAIVRCRIRNTTGRRRRPRIAGRVVDAPHDPADVDQVTNLTAFTLVGTLTLRGIRVGVVG